MFPANFGIEACAHPYFLASHKATYMDCPGNYLANAIHKPFLPSREILGMAHRILAVVFV